MAQGVLNTKLIIQLNLETWKFKIHLLFEGNFFFQL